MQSCMLSHDDYSVSEDVACHLPGWNGETAHTGDVVHLIFIAGNVEVSRPPYCCILYVDTIIVPTS